MNKKQKTKVGRKVASILCATTFAVGGFAIPMGEFVSQNFHVPSDRLVYASESETHEHAVELWSGGAMSSGYSDLKTAVEASATGDTIKIWQNLEPTASITIADKSITIEGNGYTINNATWLGNVFTVNSGATLTINNLKIDGGATTWEIDRENASLDGNYAIIPLKNFEEENRATAPVIKSAGNLIATGLTIENIYTPDGNTRSGGQNGAGISITAGTLDLNECNFKHIAGQRGAAVDVFGTLVATGENLSTDYPITQVDITDCTFENNHGSFRGGALNVTNAKNINVTGTTFKNNASTRNNGGAFMIDATGSNGTSDNGTPEDASDDFSYGTVCEKLKLKAPQLCIDDCVFEGNYCGNDGFAIENEGAESVIKNSTFKNNVGVNTISGSVGTISYQTKRVEWLSQSIENCVFDGNVGAISGIGDHATNVDITIKDTEFKNNSGMTSVLIYNAQVEMDCVTFTNENVTTSVIDARSYNTAENYPATDEFSGPTLTFNDSTITGTQGGGTGILVRAYNSNGAVAPFEVVFTGETQAEVEVNHNGKVSVESSTHTGDILVDASAGASEVNVSTSTVHNGEVVYSTAYRVLLRYETSEGDAIYQTVHLEAGTYKIMQIQRMLSQYKEGYILNWYTNSSYTTEWDYVSSANVTLYGKWEEHTHSFDSYIVSEGAIYKTCECGEFSEDYIALNLPSNLVYNGEAKAVSVVNSFDDVESSAYTVSYKVKQADGSYVITASAVNVGDYKAILTFNELTIEADFSIQKATYDTSKLKFEDLTIEYDGNSHTIEVSGLPEGVTVTYENNNQTEVGTYTVVAHFEGDSNYNAIADLTAVLTITKKPVSALPFILGGVGVVALGGVVALAIWLIKRKKK